MPKGKIIKSKEQAIERFWSYVEKTDSCWNWQGGKTRFGHGVYISAKNHGVCDSNLAHRISYSLTFDDYDTKLKVCHKCDNPSCVNPEHLFIGTQKDNMEDCRDKNRLYIASGENHVKAKLDWQQVREIRQKYKEGEYGLKKLAKEYNVHRTTIRDIVKNKTWVE